MDTPLGFNDPEPAAEHNYGYRAVFARPDGSYVAGVSRRDLRRVAAGYRQARMARYGDAQDSSKTLLIAGVAVVGVAALAYFMLKKK
jgi:hypothetical protein